jgi:hypothetical protein
LWSRWSRVQVPSATPRQQGPVAQWIERRTSNPCAEVRLLPGPFRPSQPCGDRVAMRVTSAVEVPESACGPPTGPPTDFGRALKRGVIKNGYVFRRRCRRRRRTNDTQRQFAFNEVELPGDANGAALTAPSALRLVRARALVPVDLGRQKRRVGAVRVGLAPRLDRLGLGRERVLGLDAVLGRADRRAVEDPAKATMKVFIDGASGSAGTRRGQSGRPGRPPSSTPSTGHCRTSDPASDPSATSREGRRPR